MDSVFTISRLTKLDRSNFDVWMSQADDLLQANGLDALITTNYAFDHKITAIEKKNQAKGRLLLRSTLEDSDKELVAGCATVKAIIDLLRSAYDGFQNIHSLNTNFDVLKWGESTAEQFITRLTEIKLKMFQINHIDESNRFVHKIITEMPDSLEATKAIYQHKIRSGENLDYQSLCEQVIQAYHEMLVVEKVRTERLEIEQAADQTESSGDEYNASDQNSHLIYSKDEECSNYDDRLKFLEDDLLGHSWSSQGSQQSFQSGQTSQASSQSGQASQASLQSGQASQASSRRGRESRGHRSFDEDEPINRPDYERLSVSDYQGKPFDTDPTGQEPIYESSSDSEDGELSEPVPALDRQPNFSGFAYHFESSESRFLNRKSRGPPD